MKPYCLFIIGVFFAQFCVAQDVADLRGYLAANSRSVDLNAPSRDSAFFKSLMQNKSLFVYGEGGSHRLELHDQMRAYLLQVFTRINLRYFFIEHGRTEAFMYNSRLPESAHFEYRGIDMEWGKILYRAVKSITAGVSPATIDSIPLLHDILVDTGYLHFDHTNAHKNQTRFLKLYPVLGSLFFRDSAALRACLSPKGFSELGYFLSNRQTAPPEGNRNPGMAQNLLAEISPIDVDATYLLDIGEAHSLLNRKQAVIGILNTTDVLSNRLVIMNVYCDSCSSNGEALNDEMIDFMKGDVLEAFRNSAKGELTIFDMAHAPAALKYLKKYGDLILFARSRQ